MNTISNHRVVFDGPFMARLENFEFSGELPPRSALITSLVSLISPGTELALYTGTHVGFKDPEITWARYPLYPGYSTVGVVAALGSDLVDDPTFPRPGEKILHYKPHAEAVRIDADSDFWFPLQKGADAETALFARFGQIARTAVEASKADGNVLVFGAGIVGNLAAQLFREIKGAWVAIADTSAKRLAIASRCGLTHGIISTGSNVAGSIAELTGGKGVSTVVEATGVPALVTESLTVVNRLGEVILLGSSRGKVELDAYKLVHRKATSLIGAHENRYPPKAEPGLPSQYAFCIDALSRIASGSLVVSPFITDHFAPAAIMEAYNLLLRDSDNHIGIVVEWKK